MADRTDNPSSFVPNGDMFSQLQFGGTNNDLLNRLVTILSELGTTPKPQGSQDVYDAYLQRERSRQFMTVVQQNAAVQNQMTGFFGLNSQSPLMKMAGMTLGDPNGVYARTMSSLTGNNPILAASNLYAGLTGSTVGAFGMNRNVTGNEVGQLTDIFNRNYYSDRTIDRKWQDSRIQSTVGSFRDSMAHNPGLMAAYGFNNLSDITQDSIMGARSNVSGGLLEGASQGTLKVGEINKQTWGLKDEELKQQRQKRLQEYSASFINTLKESDKAIVEKFTKGGVVDFAAMSSSLTSGNLSAVQRNIFATQNMEGHIAGGRNYGVTRGFSDEDLAAGFYASADMQMIGRHSMLEAGEGYSKNAGRVLSAGRSVFGDIGGKEIMKSIRDVIGNSTYDISNDSSAKELEDLLRRVKTTARSAGESIDSMVEIIKLGRGIAQSHPQLQYIGGAQVAEMVMTATTEAKNLNQTMSPEDINRMGGVQGIRNSRLSQALNMQTSMGSTLASVTNYLGKGNSTMQSAAAQFANSNMGPTAINGLVKTVAKEMFNGNEMQAWAMLTDQHAIQLANADPSSASLGRQAAANIPTNVFKQASILNGKDPTAIQAQIVAAIQGGATQQDVENMMRKSDPLAYTRLSSEGLLDQFYQNMHQQTPSGQRRAAAERVMQGDALAQSKQLDEVGANRYATESQRFVQEIINGNIGTAGQAWDSLKQGIEDADPTKSVQLDKVKGFLQGSDKSFKGAGAALGMDPKMLEELKNRIGVYGSGSALQTAINDDPSKFTSDQLKAIKDLGLTDNDSFDFVKNKGAAGFGYASLNSMRSEVGKKLADKSRGLVGSNIKSFLSRITNGGDDLSSQIDKIYKGDYVKMGEDINSGNFESQLKQNGVDLKANQEEIDNIIGGAGTYSKDLTTIDDQEKKSKEKDPVQQILEVIQSLPAVLGNLTTAISKASS